MSKTGLELSVVVIAYDMPREIPRTVLSLSPGMQRGVARADYELIVVDNGSNRPFDEDLCRSYGADVRFLHHKSDSPSPCQAINAGLSQARGRLCGVWIDGARLASPGILAGALAASSLHPRTIVSTLGFHLGHEAQHRSVHQGYDQDQEDRLLESVDWTADGYRLFEISSFAGSSEKGWFAPMAESNALFMPAELWRELGGYDERFRTAGGGLTNLDLYKRACDLPDSQLVTLLGEGTFHQVHGGVMTNAKTDRRAEFREEYERIRGQAFRRPTRSSFFFGSVPPEISASLAMSAEHVPDVDSRPTFRWQPKETPSRETVAPVKKGWFG